MWQLQAPDELVDWHQDWTGWLEIGDTIVLSSWAIVPEMDSPSSHLSDPAIETGDKITTVFVSGLELGKSYQLRNTITTAAGRIGEREITIRCARS